MQDGVKTKQKTNKTKQKMECIERMELGWNWDG